MRITIATTVLLAVSATAFAGSITSPQQVCITVTATEVDAGPSEQEFCADVDPQTGEFSFDQFEIELGNDFINQLVFAGQVDPSLVYAIGFVDLGAPSTFSWLISSPVAGGPYNTATHTMSASLTDGGDGSISFVPSGAATDITAAFIDATNLGIDLGGAGCIAGAGSSTCPPGGGGFSKTTGFGPSSPAAFSVVGSFDGSGGIDTYGITGSLTLSSSAVPEPATSAFIGLGLGALALLRFRR